MAELLDEALRELIPRLRRFALSLTRDIDNADDLVQGTLEKAINHWDTRRLDADLRSWLFSILYRQFIDNQRRAKRFAMLSHLFDTEEQESSTAETIFETNATLAAFANLHHEQSQILLLVAVEGMSYQAVSETLGLPLGTVMSRLSRARQALKNCMQGKPVNTHMRLLK